jgi:hypothetical protein
VAKIKSFLMVGVGAIIASTFFMFSKSFRKALTPIQTEKTKDSKLISIEDTLNAISASGLSFNLSNKKTSDDKGTKVFKGIKTSFAFYHPNSTCSIEVDISSMFNDTQKGIPYTAKIVVTDFSSEKARIECSKIAIENLLPIILRGGFASIAKTKIYEDGTIFKILRPGNIQSENPEEAMLDGGFAVESLNGGLLLTPNRFEVYITDCAIIKCGK